MLFLFYIMDFNHVYGHINEKEKKLESNKSKANTRCDGGNKIQLFVSFEDCLWLDLEYQQIQWL